MKKTFLLIITGTGIAIVLWGCGIFIQSRDGLSWPQTRGQMISSSLTIHHLPKLIDFNADPLRWYGTQVQYEYSVDGNLYLSDRLSFYKNDTGSAQEALKAMNKYRRHHEVIVYYNSKDPKQAVLEPGNIGDVLLPLIIGALIVFWGLYALQSQPLEFDRGINSYLAQGHAYQNQGKLQEALWEYNQVIKINPYFASGYSSRGNLYLQERHWDHAIADFNQAIAIDPHNALVYFTLANAYLGKKEYEKALVNMQKAVERGFNVDPDILKDIKNKLS